MKRSCGLIVIVKKGNKSIMSLRTRSDALPAGFQKWNKLFDNPNWKKKKKKLLANYQSHKWHTTAFVSDATVA